ncbi:MAG: COX15/CtaA family protein [Magnetovibrionaceae bacterium]
MATLTPPLRQTKASELGLFSQAGLARYRERQMAIWLFCVVGMIVAMVIIGGLTRLTESGLSMVEWRPFTGWFPPMSEAEWSRIFEEYRQYPEYLKLNAGMSLAQFKEIFWLEYIHRVWGRLIGLAFALPFLVFLAKGWVGPRLAPKFVFMFILGGAQGVLGWWMVKSGMVDHPEVSQYRLTAHLGLALIVMSYVLWVGLSLWRGLGAEGIAPRRSAFGIIVLVLVTALAGGFVAGLDAGYGWNTWPLMDGRVVPFDLIYLEGGLAANLFEDPATAQFNHRILALLTVAGVIGFWGYWHKRLPAGTAQVQLGLMPWAALFQAALGVATLLSVVLLPLAALHQAGAVALLVISLVAGHRVSMIDRSLP